MYEYTIISDSSRFDLVGTIDLLNEMALEGWEVVCPCAHGLVMRRLRTASKQSVYTYTVSRMPVGIDENVSSN